MNASMPLVRAVPANPKGAARTKSGSVRPRHLILLGCALLQMSASTLASAQAVSTQPNVNSRIDQGRVGEFLVGLTTEELYRIVGRQALVLHDQFAEGSFLPVVRLELEGASKTPSLVGHLDRLQCENTAAWYFPRWVVHDDRFRTEDGMGVGSTLAALRDRGWVDERGFPGPRAMHSERERFPWIYFRFFLGECEGCFLPEDDSQVLQVELLEPFPLLRQRRCAALSP